MKRPENKKQATQKNVIRDDFYDRINYYESRNIFSSKNDVVPLNNRLNLDQAALKHKVWGVIDGNYEAIEKQKKISKQESKNESKSQFTQKLLDEITKHNKQTNSERIGCKKCGFGILNF